jgi:hypothetical protein
VIAAFIAPMAHCHAHLFRNQGELVDAALRKINMATAGVFIALAAIKLIVKKRRYTEVTALFYGL